LADATAAQTAIVAEVEKIVGGIGDIFGDNITIPQIQLPAVSQLSNITIPDTVDKTLTTLNNSLPTFEQVKNATDTAISFPFEQLKVLPHYLKNLKLTTGRVRFAPHLIISPSIHLFYLFPQRKRCNSAVTTLNSPTFSKSFSTPFNTF
jgi:hypothetical protein